jgi:uncharacterized protein (DUF885 family)
MNLNRRNALLGATGALMSACSSLSDRHAMLDRHLDDLHELMLQESPHNALYGLDTGARAALRTQWPTRSRPEAQRSAQGYAAMLARLKAADGTGLTDEQRATRDAATFALELAVEGATFPYGDQTLMPMIDQEATPYPINQMIGLAASGPQLLATQQPLASAGDHEAFVERLAALGAAIDSETAWFRDEAARGVRPPRFILQTLHAQLDEQLAVPPERWRVYAAYAAGAPDAGRVAALIRQQVLPGIARQRDAVLAELPRAPDTAGVAHLPDGERYYQWALRMSTSTRMDANEVHRLGLELGRRIEAQMEALLAAQGLREGSVGQRLAALAADPRHRFANDDSGRAEAVAFCKAWVGRLRSAIPRWSRLQLKAAVDVRRVPPEREQGAAGAYMAPGSFDGARPSVFYLNLRDTGHWPRWALPTLVAHETLPGHAWQEAFEMEAVRRHPVRNLLRFNGYSEGWALYAESLVDEAGLYDGDVLARLGWLQAQQLRATRLVVDTGLHALGWTRERAVRTLAEATGRPLGAVGGEVDRYCVKPGQACGYMIGLQELLRLRQRWLRAGASDQPGFNDAVLRAGNLPLAVLDQCLAQVQA